MYIYIIFEIVETFLIFKNRPNMHAFRGDMKIYENIPCKYMSKSLTKYMCECHTSRLRRIVAFTVFN